MTSELLKQLPDKIASSERYNEPENAASFADSEGVVVSRKQAIFILEMLRKLEKKG